ncbi:MAG: F0F1 ATP synthase subunit alpha [Oscillospiraceae bacterium]|nr:F0F1 ATP synthase subunit alpha [Oscillospiraceae bacterium]
MSYLARTGRLYVTLTSASPLAPELVDKVREKATDMVQAAGGEISFWVRENSELLGGLQLRIGDTIYDFSIADKLYRLGKTLKERPVTETDGDSMISGMRKAVQDMELGIDVFQVGRVISVSDGICWLDGLVDIMYGELVEFVNGQRGMVMDIQPDRVGCIIFGRYDHIDSYSRVRRLNIMASVPVGEAMLGRVVDALGNPIDGKGRIWTNERRPIEYNAPAIPDRMSVSVPLHTGIKAIDALVPIGRGQRELIIGDRQTGKSALVIDTILSQKGQGVICIYVAVGQKRASVAEFAARLEQRGAMEYTTIVSATASDSASLQYVAPFAGAAMSEYFMYKGRDVLIIYDDLSKHAVAYRELSLLLHRPSGREAYPGDIFYLHSRLLERAARLSPEAGGGSVTALPIIETQAGDISAYIPTNVISITDGQIFLEADLFNEGQRPAVNVGLSVSRVGGAAQTKLMKQVAASLRTSLAQYRELATFTQFGADLDNATKKVLASGARMMAALRQDRFAPLADWQQALLIFAVSEGFADKTQPEDMEVFAADLYRWFQAERPELVEQLSTGKKLDAAAQDKLRAALSEFAEAL